MLETDQKNKNEDLKEISEDLEKLLQKILSRLGSQSDIIIVATKLRVIKIFINQIAKGGNKSFLSKEFNKITKKIKELN